LSARLVKLAENRHGEGFQQNIGVVFDVIGEKEVFNEKH
jgi:hypothetical protein